MAFSFIPAKDAKFHEWQNDIKAQVTTNAVAWGIDSGAVTALGTRNGTYNTKYAAISNKNTSTKQQRAAHRAERKDYEKYMRKFVKEHLLYNSAITYDEKVAMGLISTDDSGRQKIETAPNVVMKAKPGLRVLTEARVDADSSRPSMHPDADVLEVRGQLGGTQPVLWSDVPNVVQETKARFTTELPPDSGGKTLYCFYRWRNLTDDKKSGPWGGLVMVKLWE